MEASPETTSVQTLTRASVRPTKRLRTLKQARQNHLLSLQCDV